MVRIFEVKDLAQRKRILITQSDLNRETLKLQVATAQVTFAQLKARFIAIDISAFALKTISDVLGLFFPRPKTGDGKGGFFSKMMSGIRFVSAIRTFFRRPKNPAEPAE